MWLKVDIMYNVFPMRTWLNCYYIYIYIFIYFYQLEANYFTILQWLLPYIDMNQPWSLHAFPIMTPPPTSLSTRFLWVFPAHQARTLISCIQPGLVICFTLDNIHVSMLFSPIIPPSPSPTESKLLFCTSVSLFLCYCVLITILVWVFQEELTYSLK